MLAHRSATPPELLQLLWREIGILCHRFAILELASERLMWGLARPDGADPNFGSEYGMIGRWKEILKHTNGLSEAEKEQLKGWRDRVIAVCDQRNIAVHGIQNGTSYTTADGTLVGYENHSFSTFKGPNAMKQYPATPQTVKIIYDNIIRLTREVEAFNNTKGFVQARVPDRSQFQRDWPEVL